MQLYAHTFIGRPETDWEPLAVHLNDVAAQAADFVGVFGGTDLARTIGLLHDTARPAKAFQVYLQTGGTGKKINHATAAPGSRPGATGG